MADKKKKPKDINDELDDMLQGPFGHGNPDKGKDTLGDALEDAGFGDGDQEQKKKKKNIFYR